MSTQKLHINTVAGVIEALEIIFGKRVYADKAVEKILKSNKKWGSRDRGFVAENTYDMVRWWRLLWALKGEEPSLKRKSLWELFGIWWIYKGEALPDWSKFDAVRDLVLPDLSTLAFDELQSYPIWLHERAFAELGEDWKTIASEMNKQAGVVIRTNLLKGSPEQLQQILKADGIETLRLTDTEAGLVMLKRVNNFRLQAFQDGWFEVQDGGSQKIAPFLDVKPGMRVIDACAGAGGKTLQMAARMNNQGSIIAMDVEAWKLNELKKRARRNGAHNIETRTIEGSKTIKRLAESADCLLLDVPCSGTGVIKRNPDTKWKLEPEHIDQVIRIQADILDTYPLMVKPGGRFVYATCSILRSENEDQIERFMSHRGGAFSLLSQQRMAPSQYSDGFFVVFWCVFRRRGQCGLRRAV